MGKSATTQTVTSGNVAETHSVPFVAHVDYTLLLISEIELDLTTIYKAEVGCWLKLKTKCQSSLLPFTGCAD